MLISRRDFLKGLGVGALASAIAPTFLICTGKAPSFYRFTDNIKSAKVYSPLVSLTKLSRSGEAALSPIDGKIEALFKVAEKYSNRDFSFGDKTEPYIKKVKIAGELRTVLFAPAPSSYTFSVKVPPKAILDFGYALMPEAWEFENSATVFKIWLVKDEKRYLLFSDSINPRSVEGDRKWFDERVELSSHAGERVEIIFETSALNKATESAISYDYAVWSTPTLYSRASFPTKPNVLLISLDALRADHLGCYGYHRQTSPNIDKLAKNGVLFLNAFSQSSWTIPSHSSILTSKLPHKHGGTIDTSEGSRWHPLPDSNLTLAEILRENGYTTAGFTGGGYMGTENGLHQGFDVYYDNTSEGWTPFFDIERGFDRLSSFMERNSEKPFPLFIFFHTFEVHTPYSRHYFTTGLEKGRFGDTVEHYRDLNYIITATDAEKKYILSLYDGDIYHADMYVGKLIEKLKKLNLLSNTIIVLTSDHGQDFWDHYPQRTCVHGHSLYDELLHVPLIIVFPDGTAKGKVIENQVRSIDIFPTILSALSIKYEPRSIDGTSSLPIIKGKSSSSDLVAYSEDIHFGPERKSIRTEKYKYIYVPDLTQIREGHTGVDFYKKGVPVLSPIRQEELYDLENDPKELHNIAALHPFLVENFRKKVRDVFGITTAQLDFNDDRVSIRLEGVQKPVEGVTVNASQDEGWSTRDGNLKMVDDGKGNVSLYFEPKITNLTKIYLIQIVYSDKTTEQMTVERKASEKQTTDMDAVLIQQLKALGYMR